jgi:hypothetical protein
MKRLHRFRAFKVLALAVVLGLFTALPLAAQDGTVRGTVIEANTQRPLSGAQVSVEGSTRGAITNCSGRIRHLRRTCGGSHGTGPADRIRGDGAGGHRRCRPGGRAHLPAGPARRGDGRACRDRHSGRPRTSGDRQQRCHRVSGADRRGCAHHQRHAAPAGAYAGPDHHAGVRAGRDGLELPYSGRELTQRREPPGLLCGRGPDHVGSLRRIRDGQQHPPGDLRAGHAEPCGHRVDRGDPRTGCRHPVRRGRCGRRDPDHHEEGRAGAAGRAVDGPGRVRPYRLAPSHARELHAVHDGGRACAHLDEHRPDRPQQLARLRRDGPERPLAGAPPRRDSAG